MRALWLVVLVGCSPDILSGAYLCGPEQACPPDQACNGPDNSCVIPSTAEPFVCDPMVLHEPDNSPADAFPIPGLTTCISPVVDQNGCLAAGDAENWLSFTAPTGCHAVEVSVRLNYPIAFEPVTLSLFDTSTAAGEGVVLASDAACTQNNDAPSGDILRCLKFTLVGGDTYGLEIAPAGGGDCGGHCNFNRYELAVTLDTPD